MRLTQHGHLCSALLRCMWGGWMWRRGEACECVHACAGKAVGVQVDRCGV